VRYAAAVYLLCRYVERFEDNHDRYQQDPQDALEKLIKAQQPPYPD
jgi:hypothetical protein